MRTTLSRNVLISSLLPLAWLAGCSAGPAGPSVGMANPASAHCLQRGGRLERVDTTAGVTGMCHLPDGTVVEEWALFRRDHPKP